MKKTIALAALLAATALTPALAQDVANGAEPAPVAENVMVQTAQNERSERRERGNRVDGEAMPYRGEGAVRAQGDGQRRAERREERREDRREERRAQEAPTFQTPVPQAQTAQPAQPAPAQQRWSRDGGGMSPNWQGRPRRDWSGRGDGQPNAQPGGQPGWSRPAPQVVAPAQPQGNWQNREQRRDAWRNGNNGVVAQQQDNRRWNNEPRNDGQWNGQRRNDSWQNNGRTDRRDDRQWNGIGRNDTWRNDTWRNNGRADNWRSTDRRYDQRQNWQNQYRDWNRNWNRDWRRDQRYDWQRYRYSNRSLFRNDRYYAPYGWDYGYRRFSVGFSLSYVLYDQQYWIEDPHSYRLPPVYGPYRWVRYYDDVLLVDLRTGQVIDAIHGFFE